MLWAEQIRLFVLERAEERIAELKAAAEQEAINKAAADAVIAKINAIDFTYKDEAKEKYGENPNVDDAEHIGVKAQELETNPATKGTVATNENGDKMLNTDHLTAVNTAAISELSRRVLALEEVVKNMNKGA